MDIATVVALIQAAREENAGPFWPGYSIRDVPFAVYDDHDVEYIGHPNPPAQHPENLMSATSTPINGIETATLPLAMCSDAEKAVPLAYHEGFHVFQRQHFVPIEVDMFTAMAFYPDLDVDYRVLCRLEENVLHRTDWSTDQRLSVLGHLASLRRSRLSVHPSLLGYERFLERHEGTASYIEQRARQALFDINPMLDVAGHGWGRFYKVGAAICWLLADAVPDWTRRIEQGESPGDLVIEHADSTVDLAALDYEIIRSQENETLAQVQKQIDDVIESLYQPGIMRIRYGSAVQVYRAFNPSTLVSLGDGRVLHRSFFKLMIPGKGTIAVDNVSVIDHVQGSEIILSAVPCQIRDRRICAQTDAVRIDVEGFEENERVFVLGSQ